MQKFKNFLGLYTTFLVSFILVDLICFHSPVLHMIIAGIIISFFVCAIIFLVKWWLEPKS
jgi:hypothetical protein